MAASGPFRELWEETACPICLERFRDPIILDCGHNFCRACLAQYCQESEAEPCCPNCREALPQQENFRPNRQLANVIEIIERLEGERTGEEGEQREACERHRVPPKLFCKQDLTPICLVCEKSKAHADHQVVPAEEAFQEYKEKCQAQLNSLEKEKEDLVTRQQAEELLAQNWQKQVGKEKEMVKCCFEKMCAFLKENEQLRMSELDALEKEIEERQGENITRLSVEISCLSNLMAELEEKCQQPESKFLQDIRTMFKVCEEEKVGPVLHQSSWLEEKLRLASWNTSNLEDAMKKCTEILERTMDTGSLEPAVQQVNVTLDPETAHPHLVLSEDLKGMRWEGWEQDLPDNPERFDEMWAVLGRERFVSGRHSWELEVEGRIWETWSTMTSVKAMWMVGVARESVVRKGTICQYPSEGIWAVGKATHELFSSCHFWASTSPSWTPLATRNELRKVRILLDCDKGVVEFFDADTDGLIFCFDLDFFGREVLRPYFWLNAGVRMRC